MKQERSISRSLEGQSHARPRVAIQPAWSPDGEALAYSGMPDPGDVMLEQASQAVRGRHIRVAETQGDPAPRQLTDDPSTRDEHPQWSADGAYLLFVWLDEADRASLWIVPAQGGQPLLVAENVDLGGPTDDHKAELDGGQSYSWFP